MIQSQQTWIKSLLPAKKAATMGRAAYGQTSQGLEDGLFVFAQMSIRDSDGALIAYFESNRFITLDEEQLHRMLDAEVARRNGYVILVQGDPHQVV